MLLGLSTCFVLDGKLLLLTVSESREVFSLLWVLSALVKIRERGAGVVARGRRLISAENQAEMKGCP